MIWPVASLIVALRSPFTATVDVTPSLAPLPPNKLTMRPSMPANSTCVFWSERTSALSVRVRRERQSSNAASNGRETGTIHTNLLRGRA